MAAESVIEHLRRFGADGRIQTFPQGTATVDAAAAALGVEPARIAKTLAFRIKGVDGVVIVVAKGTAKLDNAKCKKLLGGKPAFLGGEECQALTGHPPGGVCPFALPPEVPVYLDESLREFDVVYPAAGAPDNCIGANLAELETWTGGAWLDLCK